MTGCIIICLSCHLAFTNISCMHMLQSGYILFEYCSIIKSRCSCDYDYNWWLIKQLLMIRSRHTGAQTQWIAVHLQQKIAKQQNHQI